MGFSDYVVTAEIKDRECKGYHLAGCLLLAGRAEVARCLDVRHPNAAESRPGGYVLGSHVMGYRVARAVVHVRGGPPYEA